MNKAERKRLEANDNQLKYKKKIHTKKKEDKEKMHIKRLFVIEAIMLLLSIVFAWYSNDNNDNGYLFIAFFLGFLLFGFLGFILRLIVDQGKLYKKESWINLIDKIRALAIIIIIFLGIPILFIIFFIRLFGTTAGWIIGIIISIIWDYIWHIFLTE